MSIDGITDQYRAILKDLGIEAKNVERIVAEMEDYYFTGLEAYKLTGGDADPDKIKAYFSDHVEVLQGKIKDYWRFHNYKRDINKTYQETKDWREVFSTTVYSDQIESQEAFIDYVEETYKTKVKDTKHLQELTGITKIYEGDSSDPEVNALAELEDTLINSRISKYHRDLETALTGGATYNELLTIDPKDYGLPEKWDSPLGADQHGSILWVISSVFLLEGTPLGLFLLPDLRSVAHEIQAPYSIVMESYKMINGWK